MSLWRIKLARKLIDFALWILRDGGPRDEEDRYLERQLINKYRELK